MNLRVWIATVTVLCLPVRLTAQPSTVSRAEQPAEKWVFVKMVTTSGDIFLELNNEKAPISVANFLKYADQHAYEGTIFHRVIPWFVIQGGGFTSDLTEQKGDVAIKNEWTNGLKNIRGTIAMARDSGPDTATREFYINVADNAKLDTPRAITGNAGYAVFGRVIAGMEVVDAIRDGVTGSKQNLDPEKSLDDLPMAPVTVTAVVRISSADAQGKAADAKAGRSAWQYWRFDESIDELPKGMNPGTTGVGAKAKWFIASPPEAIKAPTPPSVMKCTANNSGSVFNLLMASEVSCRDVRVSVRIHADAGDEDQGGGVIWRAKDADNYYVARWNPLEDNLRVYHVKAGKRTQIASADVKADPHIWHRMRVDHIGTRIEAGLNGKVLITVEDATIVDAGHVGLWTKADASSWFDDLGAVDAGEK